MFFYLLVLLFLVSCSNDLGGNAQIDWNTANIRITTPAQLRELRDSINAGNSFENRTITLANSLDLSIGRRTCRNFERRGDCLLEFCSFLFSA